MEKVLSQWMPSELVSAAPRSLRRQWFSEYVIQVTIIDDFSIRFITSSTSFYRKDALRSDLLSSKSADHIRSQPTIEVW